MSIILFSVGQFASRVSAIVFPNLRITKQVMPKRATSKAVFAYGFFIHSGVESFKYFRAGLACLASSSFCFYFFASVFTDVLPCLLGSRLRVVNCFKSLVLDWDSDITSFNLTA